VQIEELVWSRQILAKIARKHNLRRRDVEEALYESEFPLHIRRLGSLYHAYGRSAAGRYLLVVFLPLGHGRVQIVTARDMTPKERRLYRKQIGG